MPDNKNITRKTENFDGAINSWFEGLVDHIRADHFMYTTGAATEKTKKFYDDFISGNSENIFTGMRESSSKFFISCILRDYIKELESSNSKPLQLSMALSDSKILVWAVVDDNDEKTEDALIIAEAKVNGKYYEKGFYLNSTIIEKSDNLSTPPHYQKIIE
jgi:hypothetical protein